MPKKCNRKTLPPLEKAVEMYYLKTELTSQDVRELFDCARATAVRIKREVLDVMAERKVRCWTPGAISTKIAYEVWGIDIDEYEKRFLKLRKLGLTQGKEETA